MHTLWYIWFLILNSNNAIETVILRWITYMQLKKKPLYNLPLKTTLITKIPFTWHTDIRLLRISTLICYFKNFFGLIQIMIVCFLFLVSFSINYIWLLSHFFFFLINKTCILDTCRVTSHYNNINKKKGFKYKSFIPIF